MALKFSEKDIIFDYKLDANADSNRYQLSTKGMFKLSWGEEYVIAVRHIKSSNEWMLIIDNVIYDIN